MNDRFKFRVWDEGMFEDSQPHYEYADVFTGLTLKMATGNNPIEQCTGLKDKNGKLIYEGDVVICDRDFSENGRKNLIRKVIFADGSFQLERAKTIGDRYYINAFHNFEIIGNIHEQAEQKDK